MREYLIPFDVDPGAVGAEDRVGGVLQVTFGIIAHGLYDLLRIVAGLVAGDLAAQLPLACGIGDQLAHIVLQFRNRGKALQHREISLLLRGVEAAAHGLDILDGSADLPYGDF